MSCLGETEKDVWISLKNVIKNFLGNHKSADYKDILGRVLENVKALGCSMSIEVHFLHSHLNHFPEIFRRRE